MLVPNKAVPESTANCFTNCRLERGAASLTNCLLGRLLAQPMGCATGCLLDWSLVS